jgi:hypothetical protein
MSRNFPRRLQRMEMHLAQQRLACHFDDEGRSIVERIRERRLRRLAAQGRESEIDRCREPIDFSDRPQTIGGIIRSRRFGRRADCV